MLFTGLALLVVLAVLGVFALDPARVWRLAGPPDLGDVSFETLARRTTPNDALACPPGLCRAKSDLIPPVYAIDAPGLRAAFARALAGELRLEKVGSDDAALSDRWIQRSALLGFPDTIVVRVLPAGPGRSTLALYSRSQIGAGDLGVNRARIERWLALLGNAVPPIR